MRAPFSQRLVSILRLVSCCPGRLSMSAARRSVPSRTHFRSLSATAAPSSGASSKVFTFVCHADVLCSTQIYRAEDAPRFVVGHSVALAYTLISACLTGFIWFYLNRQNNKKEEEQPGSGIVGGAGGLKGDADPRWRFML
jgi:hypothetical protein